jgi:hypothetical protein
MDSRRAILFCRERVQSTSTLQNVSRQPQEGAGSRPAPDRGCSSAGSANARGVSGQSAASRGSASRTRGRFRLRPPSQSSSPQITSTLPRRERRRILISRHGGVIATVPYPIESPIPYALDTLRSSMATDLEYAWSWHCALACAALDQHIDRPTANTIASRFMHYAFGVNTAEAFPERMVAHPRPEPEQPESTKSFWEMLDEDLDLF